MSLTTRSRFEITWSQEIAVSLPIEMEDVSPEDEQAVISNLKKAGLSRLHVCLPQEHQFHL